MTEERWMTALREASDRASQAAVARQLGVSAAMVGLALKGQYTGNLARLRTLVEGSILADTVSCPVLGEVTKHKCLAHQERDRRFATANPLKAQLYRACRSGCPFSKLAREY